MAFELTDTNPFATTTFGELDTAREGFTFDPDYTESSSWISNFEKEMPDFSLNLKRSSSSFASGVKSAGTNDYSDSLTGKFMETLKSEGDADMKVGAIMKTVSMAGNLFNAVLSYTSSREEARLKEANTKASVENQMLALDNQVLYYKNQIADKFAKTMASNAVTMAQKNLRVTASNILEQTKGAAYDATKDIQMLESNAELKKIALHSEARQAEVTSRLTNNLATANLIGSIAKLGLGVSSGIESGAFGKLFGSASSKLATPYGDAIDPEQFKSANNLYGS